MRRSTLSALLLVSLTASAAPVAPVAAQTPTGPDTLRPAGPPPRPATDSLFRRARRLVTEGSGVVGRALVDSLLRAADPATPAYGDALYWHGALAPTAAEAERDYRRVIVEYPLAYYADDALLAIAELEQARGDRAAALMHLQRFVREHPGSAGRGIAALGAARLAFEQRDTRLGCSMIAVARSAIASTDVELRNQTEYYGRQCPLTAATSATTATTAAAPAPTPQRPPTSAPATTPPVAAAPPRSTVSAPASVRTDTAARSAAPKTTAASTSAPSISAPSTPAPRPPAPVSTMPAPVTPAPRAAGTMYTVQLAAYDTRPPAEDLVRKLAGRGVKARVSGTTKPFRVRLDFYRTRQEAANVVASLKARGIIGFVAEEAPPAETRSP